VHGWGKYKNLDIQLENTETGETYDSKAKKNFIERAVWKIGGEYQASDLLAIRLGYYFDEYVSPREHWSPETPDATRHGFTAGLGLNFGGFNVDAFGQYTLGVERYVHNVETGFQGDVNLSAFLFGLGLSYNFN